METYEQKIYPATLTPGTTVIVTENDRSLDNGKTWHTTQTVDLIDQDDAFNGIKTETGPSLSGFWGNYNEIRSGVYSSYCTQYDGRQWRSMKNNT